LLDHLFIKYIDNLWGSLMFYLADTTSQFYRRFRAIAFVHGDIYRRVRDALLLVNRKSPIVFLRSFEDEERPKYRQLDKAWLDFSLEARPADHLKYI
jgi:hypothetical protein